MPLRSWHDAWLKRPRDFDYILRFSIEKMADKFPVNCQPANVVILIGKIWSAVQVEHL
jgi:hypothetical protein